MTDLVQRKCLDQIRQGYLDAALILADHLEENSDPRFRQMRERINRWIHDIGWDARHDFSRNRRWLYWESVGARCRVLWQWFRDEFGRKWKYPRKGTEKWVSIHRALFDRNRNLIALLAPRKEVL